VKHGAPNCSGAVPSKMLLRLGLFRPLIGY